MSKRKITNRGSQLINTTVELDFGAMAQKAKGEVDGVIRRINRIGPRIMRNAISDALRMNGLDEYADFADDFPAEKRKINVAKVGTGLTLRVEDDVVAIRVLVLGGTVRRNLIEKWGKDGYWEFVTRTAGRDGFVTKGGKVVLRVDEDAKFPDGKRPALMHDIPYDNKVDPDGPEGAIIVNGPFSVPAVAPTASDWTEDAARIAIDNLSEEIG